MPHARDKTIDDFRDVCFVIMPFNVKSVSGSDGKRDVDFDAIYDRLFEPAISAVELPASEGGGHLRPKRTDREFHTGVITQEMFEYLEYSRFALADISSVNANVYYELGARHRAHESGTAIFRQADVVPPFDISSVKALPYIVDPENHLEESKALVTKVLTNSLTRNAWDSPIMLALRSQRAARGNVEDVLLAAEQALRDDDAEAAHRRWLEAAQLDPENPLHDLKASAYPKAVGDWDQAIRLLNSALDKERRLGEKRPDSTYSEAFRELGIAQNKRDREHFPRSGEEALRRAVHLAPEDFDAWASLGGILRRAGDREGAAEAYERAVEVSEGHPYPLLMALKLRAHVAGEWTLSPRDTVRVAKAIGFRKAQVGTDPPMDAPWSYLDLGEAHMYLGEGDEAVRWTDEGLRRCTGDWMPRTFLSALELLPDGPGLPRLADLKAAAAHRAEELSQD
jgi:tetratricopeptide (TPR) repeat protein